MTRRRSSQPDLALTGGSWCCHDAHYGHFSRAIDASTLTTSTFEMRDPSNNAVDGHRQLRHRYPTSDARADAALSPTTQYTARIVGGGTG